MVNSAVAAVLKMRRQAASASRLQLRRVPLSQLQEWTWCDGNLVHRSRRFFSVIGACDDKGYAQPLIDQPEIGTLAFLARESGDGLSLLFQLKVEPGNVGICQLAPTVQATRSNIERVHGGQPTKFLDELNASLGNAKSILVDSLQSEQGTRFLAKRNRNVVALASHADPDLGSEFVWIDPPLLAALVASPFLLNTDARSVLSCLNWNTLLGLNTRPATNAVGQLLRDSLESSRGVKTWDELLTWYLDYKPFEAGQTHRIPLTQVDGWVIEPDQIVDRARCHFEIEAYEVTVLGREVGYWDQPFVRSFGSGKMELCCGLIGDLLHCLLRVNCDIGTVGGRELIPASKSMPGFTLQNVLLRTQMSEEGGRFMLDVNRYSIVFGAINFDQLPGAVCCVSISQLQRLCASELIASNELRSAASLLIALF